MRIVIVGAGAIGGVMGVRLHQRGSDVTFLARGEHGRVLQEQGITLATPTERVTVAIPTVERVDELSGDPDMVILAVKTHDTPALLNALAPRLGAETPIACAQNGVTNERLVAAPFAYVYGICVMCPAEHLEPGLVTVYSEPINGLFDVGVWPEGLDETALALADALSHPAFDVRAVPDVMRWKYAKLLHMNYANAIEALVDGPAPELAARAHDEAAAAFAAAGIDFASAEADTERRAGLLTWKPVDGHKRGGGSSHQSLARGTGAIEVEALNGEISALGAQHGVPTPVNDLLVEVASDAAARGLAPGSYAETDLLARL